MGMGSGRWGENPIRPRTVREGAIAWHAASSTELRNGSR